jgi:hypothetical protein
MRSTLVIGVERVRRAVRLLLAEAGEARHSRLAKGAFTLVVERQVNSAASGDSVSAARASRSAWLLTPLSTGLLVVVTLVSFLGACPYGRVGGATVTFELA